MTMLLHDATNHNGLFDLLGLTFYALDTLNTARQTTVPTEFTEVVSGAETLHGATGTPGTTAAVDAIAALPNAIAAWQSDTALTAALQTAADNLVVAFCQADNPSLSNNVGDCLAYLVAQMTAGTVTGGDHVAAPTTSISVSTGGSNRGDVAVSATLRGGDGHTLQNAFSETITLSATTAAAAPKIALTSPFAVADSLSYQWPGGSGMGGSFAATDAANSLLTNGNFEADSVINQPDNWIIAVGTPGTTLFVTGQCVQTVTIGGSPTGGTYELCWVDAFGNNRTTSPLPYNATAAQVQTALQTIAGLEQVQVSTTGTSPNYTHTITFYGVGGACPALTSLSQLTGGTPTIAVATTTAIDSNTYKGQALKIVGNGSELTTLYQVLPTLAANTTYFLGFRARVKSGDSIAAGGLAVEIVNSIGGSVIADTAGNSNALAVNLTTLSNSAWTFFALDFRIPASIIQPVYLRLRLSTAITAGKTIYLDEMALTKGTPLYAGGPIVAAFSGCRPAEPGDAWTITVGNDYAGKFQKDFNRFFGMADLGLLLPTTGSTLIADSLVA